MPVTRIHWEDLPSAARAAVEQHTGPVLYAETASGGANSGIAVLATTADASLFIKGVPSEHPQARTQQREAEINPHLPPASPRLLWRVQVASWDLIGYERIIGRHADYAPGSDDLPLVAEAIAELQASRCPDLELKRAEQRWGSYADTGEAELFAGQTLLHTDLAPHNILITERAHIIDWAWPTRGAAWIDPVVLILRLMEAGHSAQDADEWVRRFPSWQQAPHNAVAAFSAANAQLWDEIAQHDPQGWKKHMALLSWDWVAYWRSRSR
ncbi:aminoglycoside phosphotransferase [Streptomyces sp. RKAG293]|uniref:aminoglycoside phosphotransferase n=1 Tax=Streptomyces sp. RKAG293 TaxID=2893403 RepID=UPI002034A139|nr:aminoglycoside phosphotransferase [Streptomyces sp. RKAG293]MCM2417908.1 aminoglycoside phosphotransferase [Streptomyces sp. RKAG293]